jgi:hypothetical protein
VKNKRLKLKIVEGVAGIWHYHLSVTGESFKPALCGKVEVMSTSLPITSWGTKGHCHETYCAECEKMAFELGKNQVQQGTLNEHEKGSI